MKNIFIYISAFCSAVHTATCNENSKSGAKVSDIWTFPLEYWAENLVVRESGQILTTITTHPKVYQVDPTGETPAVLATKIKQNLGLTGIAETTTDNFYVVGGNASLGGSEGLGTFSVYKVDVSKFNGTKAVKPSLITTFKKGGLLNGMTTLDAKKGLLLIADSTEGLVWRLNVNTGEKKKIINDPLMKSIQSLGINGLKVANKHLYWTNTDMQIVAKAPISASGAATGPGKIVANVTSPDDFVVGNFAGAIDGAQGFVAGSNLIQQFSGADVSITSSEKILSGSTAVVFSSMQHKDGCRPLYVSTSGGDAQYATGNITIPGKIVKVHC